MIFRISPFFWQFQETNNYLACILNAICSQLRWWASDCIFTN